MTCDEILAAAAAQDVYLTVTSRGRLRARGPLTPELEASLREHRPALVALLSTGDPLLDRVCDVFNCDPLAIQRRTQEPRGPIRPATVTRSAPDSSRPQSAEADMPSYKTAFPSKWLKVADLNGGRLEATIESVKLEEVGEEEKLVVRFKGQDKSLPLNVTNAEALAELAGTDDYDRWAGQEVVLVSAWTRYQGKKVPCIRIASADIGEDDLPF